MNVAITGGTGSLGHALVGAWLADPMVERLVVLSRDEVKQDDLQARWPDPRLNCFLGDVRDAERCALAFHGCDTVIHAAALKRITRGANDPWEFIKTNILGTVNVILGAMRAGVHRVLVISSDKAVEATNLYGKTKAVAEDVAIQFNTYTIPQGTRISVLRYGNVIGSRGSVWEHWVQQAARGEFLTLTDERMTRFLVSFPQAVSLVQKTLSIMEGGEIFVPTLPAAYMRDLGAILSRHPPLVTGIRPGGEKLHEVLLSDEERTRLQLVDASLVAVLPSHHAWRTEWPGPRMTLPPLTSDRAVISLSRLREWLTNAGLLP